MPARTQLSLRNSPAPAADPPARFRDLVAAEWLKLRSLRSTWWTVGLASLFAVGMAVAASVADYQHFPHYSRVSQRDHPFSLHDAFTPGGGMMLMLAAAALGATAIAGEYGTGAIRSTIAAVPARGSVLVAKAVALAALWTAAGAVTSAASFAASQAILAGRHAAASLTGPGTATALAAFVLVGPVCALVGLGLGALLRHTAAALAAVVFLLLMLPILLSPHSHWSAAANHATVFAAWERLTRTWGPPAGLGGLYASGTASWLDFLLWPLIAVAAALPFTRRGDL